MTDNHRGIHPTAIISPRAQIDSSVEVAAYTVIDGDVVIGPGCRVGPHVYLTGSTAIGARNQFHAGCVIGDAPQDLKYKGEPTRLVIGDDNIFREGCTVHRSTRAGEATTIGSHNFFMANSHVGHNCLVADHVIIANGALLGGHAQVADRAFISGNCLLHQFVRVGTLALMQGGSKLSSDLPPYTIVRDTNKMCGLNMIGLRRNGIGPEARLELKRLYHLLFRSGKTQAVALAEARSGFSTPTALALIDFVASSKRGLCRQITKTVDDPDDDID